MTAMTFAELQKMKKPREQIVKIYTEDEPVDELNKARRKLREIEFMGSKATPKMLADAQKRMRVAEAAVKKITVEIKLQSIGRVNYEALVDSCPPTDEDHEEARRQLGKEGDEKTKADFHFEDFAPKLIAASAVEPKMTEAQARELLDTWNSQEGVELFQAAMVVNTTRRVADWGNG